MSQALIFLILLGVALAAIVGSPKGSDTRRGWSFLLLLGFALFYGFVACLLWSVNPRSEVRTQRATASITTLLAVGCGIAALKCLDLGGPPRPPSSQ